MISDIRPKVGIDDMALYVPGLFLPIADLAKARNIEYAKLNKGLGLQEMSVPDAQEDAATMAANAVRQLIERNQLHPSRIGRLYVGTESGLDGAKPVATYVLEMLQEYLAPTYGADCLLHCDVVDMTFACIGAVDALHNTLDWIRAGSERMGIIVATDYAKYDLESTGEYTQGAGAVATLLKEQPRLLALGSEIGTATVPVHDFFKPQLRVSKSDLLQEALRLAGQDEIDAQDALEKHTRIDGAAHPWSTTDDYVTLHRETPVFDGPYSNDCYRERIGQALMDYQRKTEYPQQEAITDNWRRLVFHLPYAFQARRMFSEVFLAEARKRGDLPELLQELSITEPLMEDFASPADYRKAYEKFLRAITKTNRYRRFVAEKIERGERWSARMGNLYTGSILLSLMSILEADLAENNDLSGAHLGFFAYGSGSKAKVFVGEVQKGWTEVVAQFHTVQQLDARKALDYETYEALHRGKLQERVGSLDQIFVLQHIEDQPARMVGARTYRWIPGKAVGATTHHVSAEKS